MNGGIGIGSYVRMSWEFKVRLSRSPGNDDHIREFGAKIGRVEEINHGLANVMWYPSLARYDYDVNDLIEI